MSEGKVFPSSTFCWVELGTSDATSARSFYSDLLGWDTNAVDMGAMGTYTLLQLDSHEVAGLYDLSDDQKQLGVPPHWLSYVLVDDADASANHATELGGNVTMGPFDVPNVGRMAIVRDPTGAVFALFQAGEHKGAVPMDNKPGMFCWNELATRDPDAAKAFYCGLFGWTSEESDMGHMGTYTTYKNEDRLAAGMFEISKEMGDVTPSWMVYFAVGDCDTAVEKAHRAGANVVVPPSDIPDVGRFSVLEDPQGAAFAMIELNTAEAN